MYIVTGQNQGGHKQQKECTSLQLKVQFRLHTNKIH